MPFDYQDYADEDFSALFAEYPKFKQWFNINTNAHKVKGYRIVTISLKRAGIAPGDMTVEEMNLIADLADKYTFGELRTTHEQNISLVDVPQKDLFELWQTLERTTWLVHILVLLPILFAVQVVTSVHWQMRNQFQFLKRLHVVLMI
jgi:sulfite reductase (NADPH) hemoprotein beta-component